MSGAFNQVSDWLATYWPTIVAIVTSSTFVYMLMRFIIQLILIKVRAKTTKGINEEVVKKYTALEARVNQVVGELEGLFTASLEKYSQMTSEQFDVLMQKYQKEKKEYLNAVINGKQDFVALIEEAKNIKEKIEEKFNDLAEETKTEVVEMVEEIKEQAQEQVNETVEEVKEFVEENKIESINTEKKDNEYIVVKKVYGE